MNNGTQVSMTAFVSIPLKVMHKSNDVTFLSIIFPPHKECDPLILLTNGRLGNFSEGASSATFQCDEGYFPTNKTTVTCTNGNWIPFPQCNRTDNTATTPNTSMIVMATLLCQTCMVYQYHRRVPLQGGSKSHN